MTFEEWHDEQGRGEWHKDHRESLEDAWMLLDRRGVSASCIAEVFNTLVEAVRDQYGD